MGVLGLEFEPHPSAGCHKSQLTGVVAGLGIYKYSLLFAASSRGL